jgi:hypothetical protein
MLTGDTEGVLSPQLTGASMLSSQNTGMSFLTAQTTGGSVISPQLTGGHRLSGSSATTGTTGSVPDMPVKKESME